MCEKRCTRDTCDAGELDVAAFAEDADCGACKCLFSRLGSVPGVTGVTGRSGFHEVGRLGGSIEF